MSWRKCFKYVKNVLNNENERKQKFLHTDTHTLRNSLNFIIVAKEKLTNYDN